MKCAGVYEFYKAWAVFFSTDNIDFKPHSKWLTGHSSEGRGRQECEGKMRIFSQVCGTGEGYNSEV